jgi:hypothetical protein
MSSPIIGDLCFSSRQSFRLFAEGVQALGRFQDGGDRVKLREAIALLEQCAQSDPSELCRFQLATARSLDGPDGERQAMGEFKALADSTANSPMRLAARCNQAIMLSPDQTAEKILEDALAEISAGKKDPRLDRLGKKVRAALQDVKSRVWSSWAGP